MRRLLLAIAFAAVATSLRAQEPPADLTLPLHVHLVRGVEVTRRGIAMQNWIAKEDVETAVLDEVNRIWRQAGIRWSLVAVTEERFREGPPRDRLVSLILAMDRFPSKDQQSQWGQALTGMARRFDPKPGAYHVFVLSYIGSTMQGEAFFRPKFAFVGAWTDKPSKGFDAPQKVKLVEPEPIRVGSIARTIAHEVGHLVGLKHDDCANNCLMGGTKSEGYLLTRSEIETARRRAVEFLAGVR